jgi:tetratricopeptide (TPR) repeat protein
VSLQEVAHHMNAAVGYIELQLYAEAEKELDQIPDMHRDRTEVLGIRLEIYQAMERWKEMRGIAQDIVKRRPEMADGWVALAFATRRTGSIPAAREILLEAARRFPDEAVIVFNLGCYACQSGDLEAAKEYVLQAIQRNPDFREMARTDEDLQALWGVF